MLKTCGEQDVRRIVQEEMENRINVRDEREITNLRKVVQEEITKLQPNTRNEDTDKEENGKQSGQDTVTSVIEEIYERKSRQNNMVVFGIQENKSENREERDEQDKNIILTLYKDCKIQLDPENIKKVRRLGRYNREQPFRPMMVTFNSIEPKLTLFKNIHYIRKVKKYEEIRV